MPFFESKSPSYNSYNPNEALTPEARRRDVVYNALAELNKIGSIYAPVNSDPVVELTNPESSQHVVENPIIKTIESSLGTARDNVANAYNSI